MARSPAGDLITRSYNLWRADAAPRIAAALTFYILLSIAPMLVVLVGIIGRWLGRPEVIEQLRQQTDLLAGPVGSELVQQLAETASPSGSSTLPLIAAAIAVYAATRVFRELRGAFDAIWDIQPLPPPKGDLSARARAWLHVQWRDNLAAFTMLLVVGTLFAASFLASNVLAVLADRVPPVLGASAAVVRLADSTLSIVLVTVLFAMVYRYLPRASIAWRDVWIGALASSLLFVAGRILLGLYFEYAAPGSAYGAAGSLVAFLVWTHFSVQLALLGAYFTHVWAYRYGSHANEREPREREARGDYRSGRYDSSS
jgi:membrane protein